MMRDLTPVLIGGMPKGVKIGLIILVVLLVVGGGTCAAFVTWVKSNEPEWRSQGKEAAREGQLFGAGKKEIACVDQVLERSQGCEGKNPISKGQCFAFEGIYLNQCLTAAERTGEGVCGAVPEQEGLMSALSFAKTKCTVARESCLKTYQQLAQLCASRKKAELKEAAKEKAAAETK